MRDYCLRKSLTGSRTKISMVRRFRVSKFLIIRGVQIYIKSDKFLNDTYWNKLMFFC